MAVAAPASRVPLPARARGRAFRPLDIEADRCKGCELCVGACPPAVLALDPGVVNRLGHHPVRLTDPTRCTSCALCARICPDAVFTVYARPRETARC